MTYEYTQPLEQKLTPQVLIYYLWWNIGPRYYSYISMVRLTSARWGSINTSESIYPGGQIRQRGVGGGGGRKSVRSSSRLAGQIRKASGLMQFYKYHN